MATCTVVEKGYEHESTLYQAIISATYTIKKHLDLKKTAPLLTDKKTISKSTRRLIKSSEKNCNIDWFIQALLKLDVNGFALFFSALEAVGDENHRIILSVLSTELKRVNLSKLIKVPSDEEAVETIERIRSTYFHESIHQGLPEGSQSTDTIEIGGGRDVASRLEQTPTPEQATPAGDGKSELVTAIDLGPLHLKPTAKSKSQSEIHTFSRLTCGTFYSSAHGVSVTIPEQAFPSTVSEFNLTMTASLESPLPFDPQCYSPCSAIVSLKCNPPIEEFADYVTVEMPHCVLNVSDCEDHLCVLTAPDDTEGVEFQEDPEIEVDFTESRYVVFKTKHFSRCMAAVSKRVCKQKRFSIQMKSSADKLTKAKSLDSYSTKKSSIAYYRRSKSHPVPSSVHPAAVTEFCVAMFTPRIKAGETAWNVIFTLACCAVPTAFDELEKSALKLLDEQCNVVSDVQSYYKQFTFNQPLIKFIPASFHVNGWSVSSQPTAISRNGVEEFFMKSKESSVLPPNCQQYRVERDSDHPGEFKVDITVEGADCYGEKVLFTLLCPSLCPASAADDLVIPSIADLYSRDSLIRQALSGTTITSSDSVSLSLNNRDTISFLAELSFHLHNWKAIGNLLNIEQVDIANIAAAYANSNQQFEAAFQMLRTWVVQNSPSTSLFFLLDALRRARIIVNQGSWRRKFGASHSLCEEEFGGDLLRTRLPRQIASQWRFVARFLGVEESDIDNISECRGSYGVEYVVQQAREMLHVHAAKFPQSRTLDLQISSPLKDAIRAVYEHSGCLADAVWFLSFETPIT